MGPIELYQFIQISICRGRDKMAIRNVVIRGDALLTKKSRIVERFDERLHTTT